MTKDELIGKQQLEIEELKEKLSHAKENLRNIRRILICVGGPLNDNFHQYTKKQLKPFFDIENYLDMELIEKDEGDWNERENERGNYSKL